MIRRTKKGTNVNNRMNIITKFFFRFVIMCMVIIVCRIVQIYIVHGDKYSKDALSDRKMLDHTLEYKRGDITDRNGVVLAKSEASYNIIMDKEDLKEEAIKEKKSKGKSIGEISDEFESEASIEGSIIQRTFVFLSQKYNINYKDLVKTYLDSNKNNNKYIVLKKDLNTEKAQVLKDKWQEQTEDVKLFNENANELKKDKTNIELIKNQEKLVDKISEHISENGIWLENYYKRVYPYNELAANLIGFVNNNGDPIIGVESSYDDTLRGKNGRTYQYYDTTLGVVEKTMQPVNGNNVKLTLDIGIQKIITDKIIEYNKKVKFKNMSILVMNPSNGEILGMASTPFFDLNNPSDTSGIEIPKKVEKDSEGNEKLVEQKWEDLSSEEQSKLLNQKWQNMAVSFAFEPGSTFKPITFSAGLELKKFNLDTKFVCDGGEQIADKYIACSNVNGHGTLTAAQAIEVSCNDALMKMGSMIGAEEFIKYQKLFNFGRQIGVDLPNEIGGPSLIHNLDDMGPVDLATNSFGQNFNVSMLQLAAADGCIGNNGKYYKPHVGMEILDSNNELIKRFEPELMRKVISKDTANKTKIAMRMVVEEGFMKKWGNIPGYEHQLFGKTGTAEKQPRSEGKYITSFIEMAPFDNPQVLVYVVIDEPENENAGTVDATMISTDIMKDILPTLDIKSTVDYYSDEKK